MKGLDTEDDVDYFLSAAKTARAVIAKAKGE